MLAHESRKTSRAVTYFHCDWLRFSTKLLVFYHDCHIRIQQLQLVASGVRGDNLKALWQQITTEISLQKNKALLMAYHMRDKSVDGLLLPPAEDDGESASSKSQELRERVLEYASQREREGEVPPCRQVRDITIVRKEREPLGMTVTVSSVLSLDIGLVLLVFAWLVLCTRPNTAQTCPISSDIGQLPIQ